MREPARSGVVGPLLTATLGASGLAALALAADGGRLLAFLVYGLGGSVLLLAAATCAAFRPAARLQRALASLRRPNVAGLRHG